MASAAKRNSGGGVDAFRAGKNVVPVAPSPAASSTKRGQALTSVVFLGHVPHGFYEEQMQGFFSQFGAVEKLRLARSKKTTRSKGYACVHACVRA